MKQFNQKFIYALFIFLAFLSFSEAKAQVATPTPTPTPEVVDKTESSLTDGDKEENVKPENLQGVPDIAPNYESKERDLPDLGRVGVDMLSQKPLSCEPKLQTVTGHQPAKSFFRPT